mgnify:CR=1 FL=1
MIDSSYSFHLPYMPLNTSWSMNYREFLTQITFKQKMAFVIVPSTFVHQHVRECVGVSRDRRGSEREIDRRMTKSHEIYRADVISG